MINNFKSDNLNKQNLREGHLKASFIYLLIDPRRSENLPCESKVSKLSNATDNF